MGGQPGGHDAIEGLPGVWRHDELRELVPDPLRRHDLQTLSHLSDCPDRPGLPGESERALEPEQPQHAQGILGERDLRIQRGPQDPGGQVGQPTVGIDRFHVHERQGDGVHGEVAPGEIGLDVVGERDLRFAGIVAVDLVAKGRYLDNVPVLAGSNSAERRSDAVDDVRPGLEYLGDPIRPGIGGEVVILQRPLEKGVTDRTANQEQLMAGQHRTADAIGPAVDQARPGNRAASGSPAAGYGPLSGGW